MTTDGFFHGWCDEIGCHVSFNNISLPHIAHHSPDGFEWGYGGSGSADLALSILSLVIKEPKTVKIWVGYCGEEAWRLHQDFKRHFIISLPDKEWLLSLQDIENWIAQQPVFMGNEEE